MEFRNERKFVSKLKDLENKVAALEEEIKELRAQLLTLALQPRGVTAPFVIPAVDTNPNTIPQFPTIPQKWPPYTPYIGDPLPGSGTITISCQTNSTHKSLGARNEQKEHS